MRALLLSAGCVVLAAWPLRSAFGVSCGLAVSPLAFGNYNPLLNTPNDTVASVQVSCSTLISVLVNFSVSLSAGGGTLLDRRMSGSQFALPYQVYVDSNRSQIWGDGTGGSGEKTYGYLLAAATSVNTTLSGYGRIQPKQNVGPGSYTDSLVVTVTY